MKKSKFRFYNVDIRLINILIDLKDNTTLRQLIRPSRCVICGNSNQEELIPIDQKHPHDSFKTCKGTHIDNKLQEAQEAIQEFLKSKKFGFTKIISLGIAKKKKKLLKTLISKGYHELYNQRKEIKEGKERIIDYYDFVFLNKSIMRELQDLNPIDEIPSNKVCWCSLTLDEFSGILTYRFDNDFAVK